MYIVSDKHIKNVYTHTHTHTRVCVCVHTYVCVCMYICNKNIHIWIYSNWYPYTCRLLNLLYI